MVSLPLQLSATLHDLYGMQIVQIAFWEIRFTRHCICDNF
jgi:hypothetical protein